MGGGRLRELNHMGSLFREEVLTHLSFVFRLLRVVQYTQRIKRSDHVYSGRLQGVKINGNYYKTVTPKDVAVAFKRWSFMRSSNYRALIVLDQGTLMGGDR